MLADRCVSLFFCTLYSCIPLQWWWPLVLSTIITYIHTSIPSMLCGCVLMVCPMSPFSRNSYHQLVSCGALCLTSFSFLLQVLTLRASNCMLLQGCWAASCWHRSNLHPHTTRVPVWHVLGMLFSKLWNSCHMFPLCPSAASSFHA